MPIGLTSGVRSPGEINMSQYEVRNRYHSQGLAAGGSALLDAINRGKVHLAKFILDAGEYDVVNTRDFKGKTPLIRACYIKEEKTRGKACDLLLNKGADVNIQDDVGRTALSYACEMRTNDVVRILVKNNVDPDIADEKGNTALIYSAMVGNDTAIEILIRSFRRLGLNVDHVNNDGLTALLISAKNGFIESASILSLEGKACISFRDREKGLNAEEWARAQGCSTPEVLSFSPQAALLNYKSSRLDPSSRGREAGTSTDQDDLYDFSNRATRRSSKTRVKVSPPPRRNDQDEEIDDINRRFNSIRTRSPTDSFKVGSSPRHKRGSLPIIKFSGLFSKNSNGDAQMSVPKSGKKSPEGGFMRKRKSSKDHSRKSPTLDAVRPRSAESEKSRSRKSSSSRDEPDGESRGSSQVSLDSGTGEPHVPAGVVLYQANESCESALSTASTLASTGKVDVDFDSEELTRYHCFAPVEESESISQEDSHGDRFQAGTTYQTGIALNQTQSKLG